MGEFELEGGRLKAREGSGERRVQAIDPSARYKDNSLSTQSFLFRVRDTKLIGRRPGRHPQSFLSARSQIRRSSSLHRRPRRTISSKQPQNPLNCAPLFAPAVPNPQSSPPSAPARHPRSPPVQVINISNDEYKFDDSFDLENANW